MEINLSLVDVVFAELSIATIGYNSSQCVDPNDYDALCSLFREVLLPWYDRLLPDNRQRLGNTLAYVKSAGGALIIDRVISNCPHLPFVGDVEDPMTMVDALLDVFSVNCFESHADSSHCEVIEDRLKANDVLIGMTPTRPVDAVIQTQAEEVRRRFFGQ